MFHIDRNIVNMTWSVILTMFLAAATGPMSQSGTLSRINKLFSVMSSAFPVGADPLSRDRPRKNNTKTGVSRLSSSLSLGITDFHETHHTDVFVLLLRGSEGVHFLVCITEVLSHAPASTHLLKKTLWRMNFLRTLECMGTLP